MLDGEPIVVMQDGELIERNLKRERLSAEEVAEEARAQNIAHLADVKFAILETNGRISFIKNNSVAGSAAGLRLQPRRGVDDQAARKTSAAVSGRRCSR